ncbi:adenylate kinase [Paenibacillus sp. SI8]|uniref:adenylate kinase n=1 Tax=unclassified Paenibacillus TaxID=185978 RepID=UPI003466EB1A
MPVNIALTGHLRSGKDTVGAYLTERYGYTRFAFGDELKRYANDIFDVNGSAKPRELYQWFGQTMRERDPDVWVRKCFDKISEYRVLKERADAYRLISLGRFSVSFRVVISDLRQQNEYARCRYEGFVIIRVAAPEGVRINRAIQSVDTFKLVDLHHETESHVNTFAVDYEIVNDGSVEDLYAKVDAIMAEVGARA